jgi:signal transduction histidine kinase
MGFLHSIAPLLASSAKERVKQVPVRLLLAALVAWAMNEAGMLQWVPLWLAVAVLVQAFELWAMAPFRRAEASQSPLSVFVALASTTVMATTYAAMALMVWSTNHPALVTLAALTMAGGLLTNVASGIASRRIFFIGGSPYLAALALMPAIKVIQGDTRGVVVMTLSAILFVGMVLNIYWRVHGSREAEVKSRAEAETRLEQAQAAMADRAAMAAIVSHELRTPVSAILAGAHVIRDGKSPEHRQETADLIIDAGRLMTGMLNDLLDHSKMEAGAMAMESRDFELGDLMRDTVRFWAAPAADKGLTLDMSGVDSESVWLRGDPVSSAPDHQQPCIQRDQVHADGRDPPRSLGAAWRREALSDPDRHRPGRRHCTRRDEPAVHPLRTGVGRGGAHLWRDGLGPDRQSGAGAVDGRRPDGREHAGAGRGLHPMCRSASRVSRRRLWTGRRRRRPFWPGGFASWPSTITRSIAAPSRSCFSRWMSI